MPKITIVVYNVLALAATDDPICTEQAMNRLRWQIPNTLMAQRRIRPDEVGGRAIGHIRFFSSAFAQTLWPLAVGWFDQQFPAGDPVDLADQGVFSRHK